MGVIYGERRPWQQAKNAMNFLKELFARRRQHKKSRPVRLMINARLVSPCQMQPLESSIAHIHIYISLTLQYRMYIYIYFEIYI